MVPIVDKIPHMHHHNGHRFHQHHPRYTLFIINLLIFILFACGAETYLGAVAPADSPPLVQRYINLRQHPPNSVSHFTPPPHTLSYTDNLIPQPYRLETDQYGFIASHVNHEQPERILLFLGGSTTENMYIAEESRFPYEVGRLLESHTGRPTNSHNAGFSGSHSLHSINVLLNKGLAIEPDQIILMHNINDAVSLMYQQSYWAEEFRPLITTETSPTPQDELKAGLQALPKSLMPHLYRELHYLWQSANPTPADEFAAIRPQTITIDQDDYTQKFGKNLQLFIDICHLHQIEPILLTQPSRFTAEPEAHLLRFLATDERQEIYPQLAALHQAFNQTIRDIGDENDVRVIDLAAQIPQDAHHLYDIVHLTDQGSLLAAELIAAELDQRD